jgi:hypothetical protein
MEITINTSIILNSKNESILVPGLQESNLDSSTWSIQPGIDGKAVYMKDRKRMNLFIDIVHAWRLFFRKAHITQYFFVFFYHASMEELLRCIYFAAEILQAYAVVQAEIVLASQFANKKANQS